MQLSGSHRRWHVLAVGVDASALRPVSIVSIVSMFSGTDAAVRALPFLGALDLSKLVSSRRDMCWNRAASHNAFHLLQLQPQ